MLKWTYCVRIQLISMFPRKAQRIALHRATECMGKARGRFLRNILKLSEGYPLI